MPHSLLIALHTAAGVIAFGAGSSAIIRRAALAPYFWSLTGCIGLLAAVAGVDWAGLDTTSRAVFCAFIAVGGYLIWRAGKARRLWPAGAGKPPARYLGHLGFTLAALFDAAVVIAALDAGAPTWALIVAGAGIAAAGHRAIHMLKTRLAADAARPVTAPSPPSRPGPTSS